MASFVALVHANDIWDVVCGAFFQNKLNHLFS